MAFDEEVPSLHMQEGVGLPSCDVMDDEEDWISRPSPCGGIVILGREEYA